ncbi:MAG: hypothetical protein A2V64_01865 [Bacteroidetes bacterium RBG_13_43_22]|nr:MAG: hypothetical protein A2V64_01865 [Bacteroidetes bacterium RBG_13_43_22]
MKKSSLFLLAISFVFTNPAIAQGLLAKVTDSVRDELTGNSNSNSYSTQEAEPLCACAQPELIFDLGGKLKIDYKELGILTMDDGSFLLRDEASDIFYIIKAGVIQGPYDRDDQKIAGYESFDLSSTDQDDMVTRYKGIISKSGEKYLITMGGKTYGPYDDLADFAVTKSRDKFAAIVYVQEKEYSVPKFVTNIPNVTFDVLNTLGAMMCGSIKYDEILVVTDRIMDLQGKTLFTIKEEMYDCDRLFVNTTNTRFGFYDYGALIFSDNTSLQDVFNPYLLKVDKTVYLAYMYYSPKRNAIMQCKIPF